MTRFLITGVAGFIGSHLADRLREDGHTVVGIDNLTTGRAGNVNVGVTFAEYDIASPDAAGTVFYKELGPEVIVHCAASYDDRNKWHRDTDTNVTGAINVAIAAREWGARVVYFQTALIYGNNPKIEWGGGYEHGIPISLAQPINPENSYAISKYAAEQYLRHSGVPLLTLRLANIYGPRNLSGPIPAFFKRITAGEPCTVVDSRRDFVYIDDLVDLVAQAIDQEATGTYHVSTGRDYAIGQLYSAVCDAMGRQDIGAVDTTPRGDDDAPTILLDPTETLRDFGWQATTDLDEGVERAVEWYREHGVSDVYTHLKVPT